MPGELYIDGRRQVATAFVHYTDSNGDSHVLLGRRMHKNTLGRHTFPGGFIEATPPETVEEAALRELNEETNLDFNQKKHPFTGAPLKFGMDTIHYKARNKKPPEDVHVLKIDLGQLSDAQIAQLQQQTNAQDDLAQVAFVNTQDLNKYKITGQNRRIIYETLGQSAPSSYKAPVNTAIPSAKPYQNQQYTSANPTMQGFSSSSRNYSNAREQAEAIWRDQVEPLLNQGKSVGLLYAANDKQAQDIYAGYSSGQVDGIIQGTGQAPVFAEIARMIKEKNLQNKVHILPVSTSKIGGDNMSPNNHVGLQEIDRDMANVASHRAAGWEIRGIANQSGYAIGGGNSTGWRDPQKISIVQQADGSYVQQLVGNNKAPVGGISQGEYTEKDLQTIANYPMDQWPSHLQNAAKQAPPLAPIAPIPKQNKSSDFKHKYQETLKEKSPLFTSMEANALTVKEIENNLGKGIILQKSSSQTQLDFFIQNKLEDKQAANLLVMYTVKNVMGDLATQVKIDMVDNSRSGDANHDKHAMKIQFNSQAEAQRFAEKLLKEQGIHSHTLGAGVMKTPQNGAIYLTAQDLETMAKNAKLSTQENTGIKAYTIKAQDFEHQKRSAEESSNVEDNTVKQFKRL